jgi:hypothetical protein
MMSRAGRPVAALALVAASIAAACESPTVPGRGEEGAYNFALEGTVPPLVVRWPVGYTVRVFVAAGQDPANAATLQEAVAHGVRAWNQAALYGEYRVAVTTRAMDADVILGWSDAELPVEPPDDCRPGGGGRAVTTFCLDPADPSRLRPFPVRTPEGLEIGRPRMIILVRVFEAGDPLAVRRLVAHELGHALGIGRHSQNEGDLMWSGILGLDAPSAADRATIRILYQTRPDIVP